MLQKSTFVDMIMTIRREMDNRAKINAAMSVLTGMDTETTVGDGWLKTSIRLLNLAMHMEQDDGMLMWWIQNKDENKVIHYKSKDNGTEMSVLVNSPERLYDFIKDWILDNKDVGEGEVIRS